MGGSKDFFEEVVFVLWFDGKEEFILEARGIR